MVFYAQSTIRKGKRSRKSDIVQSDQADHLELDLYRSRLSLSLTVVNIILIIVTMQHTHHPATRSAHVTPMLRSLHWLPTEQRIEYKLSLHCFKIISHQAPFYLSELLHLYTPSRQLLSSADNRVQNTDLLSLVISVLSITRLHLSRTNSLLLSVILPLSVLSNLP